MRFTFWTKSLLVTFTISAFAQFTFSDELPPRLGKKAGGDELPSGLMQAIANPAIPTIVDATILGFNKEGHGEIKVNAVYKNDSAKAKFVPPKSVRGYGYAGSDNIAPLRVVIGKKGRFLLFLNGDLLHSTYNNRFPIREGKNGKLEVGVGFNGGGGPWKPLGEIVRAIPKKK
ncbi:MAG: hypothetical protein CMI26_14715 [Opitutae bacterium]|jgi:hypothetical protein|nr:hypothetical protein [Opitutae bacterium]